MVAATAAPAVTTASSARAGCFASAAWLTARADRAPNIKPAVTVANAAAPKIEATSLGVGTDVSEPGINKARAGIYTKTAVSALSPERLRRFFSQTDAGYLDHMRQKKLVEREDELMTFFMLDIKKSYVDMLQANGFPDISKGHLISMAALHIDDAQPVAAPHDARGALARGDVYTADDAQLHP